MIGEVPGASASLVPLLEALPCAAIAFDLAGLAESEGSVVSVEEWARQVLLALDQAHIGQVRIYAHRGGCTVAVASALLARPPPARDLSPWRQQAILGRGRWDAEALRDVVRDYALETLADPDREEHVCALLQAVELYEAYQAKVASCNVRIEAALKCQATG